MALTGLGLVGFVTVHLIGNLTFFVGPEAFNAYAHKLLSLGPLLYLVEIGLVGIFLLHAVFATAVYLNNRQARAQNYDTTGNAGDPSLKTISSRTMIYTGIILFVFVIIHVKTFKYGTYYAFDNGGESIRDLYRLVVEIFQSPIYTFGYVLAMVLLGYHLRHGFWSAFQSLGTMHARYTKGIYGLGVLIAIVLAVGFLFLPVYVYFGGGT
jgi:succinate dehydrogenase / fumarate reductase cytochrome b subunit